MYQFKRKHSTMLRMFINCFREKTVSRNYSFYKIMGITWTEDVNRDYRFNLLLDSSCRRCSSSSAAEMALADRMEKLTKELTALNVTEENGVKENLNCHDNLEIKKYKGWKMKRFSLKEENLELFEELANGDTEMFDLLRRIQVRIDVTSAKYGLKVKMEKQDWLDLVNSTPTKRGSFVACLVINAAREVKRQILNPPTLYDLPENYDECDESHSHYDDVMCYHLFHNSMFLKFRMSAVKQLYYAKGFTAMLYSSPIVFDCSYDSYMEIHEIKQCAKQLTALMSMNIKSTNPFHIMLCNLNKDTRLAKIILKQNPLVFTNDYPVTVTEKSYLDIFPKSNIVYLTPHCTTSLKTFDVDKIYIVGAYVDKCRSSPRSLAKAKELGLEMARFPIDEFLDWGLGSKCLSLPHVLKIMHDLKVTNGNWKKAFEVIPERCLCKTRIKNKDRNKFESEIKEIYHSVAPGIDFEL